MKSLKKIIVCVICVALFGTFFGCASLERKEYNPSDDKYFVFTEVLGEDGQTAAGYSVALNSGITDELPEILNLPSEHEGKPVVAVAEGGFKGSAVKKVCIPSSIKTVEAEAFRACKELTKVYFYAGKQGCTDIKAFAFTECGLLADLDLPKTLQNIGAFAFSFTAIKSVEIPRPVTAIGGSAFSGCSDLSRVEIAVKLAEVGENAFSKCADNLVIVVAESNPYFYSKDGVLYKK